MNEKWGEMCNPGSTAITFCGNQNVQMNIYNSRKSGDVVQISKYQNYNHKLLNYTNNKCNKYFYFYDVSTRLSSVTFEC